MGNKYIILTIIAIFFNQCNFTKRGAVSFTFDDQYIEEWVKYSDLFDKYNIKATFFISRPHLLDSEQVNALRFMESKGHEIACHGMNHKNALDFVDSIETYIIDEITPAKEKLSLYGFEIESHAYPFGNAPRGIDSILMNEFTYVRKATWNNADTTLDYYDEIFAKRDNYRIINSMGIDYNYNISFESIRKGIDRAKEKNEVLIFHAHKIESANQNYTISPEYLERVFRLCEELNVKSIRIRDLDDFFKQ